jgi:hypothetical protein
MSISAERLENAYEALNQAWKKERHYLHDALRCALEADDRWLIENDHTLRHSIERINAQLSGEEPKLPEGVYFNGDTYVKAVHGGRWEISESHFDADILESLARHMRWRQSRPAPAPAVEVTDEMVKAAQIWWPTGWNKPLPEADVRSMLEFAMRALRATASKPVESK